MNLPSVMLYHICSSDLPRASLLFLKKYIIDTKVDFSFTDIHKSFRNIKQLVIEVSLS